MLYYGAKGTMTPNMREADSPRAIHCRASAAGYRALGPQLKRCPFGRPRTVVRTGPAAERAPLASHPD